MPWDAQGRWIPEKRPVPQAGQLPVTTGLLAPPAGGPVAPDQTNPFPLPAPLPNPPSLEGDTVEARLTGLLDANSPYIQRARQSGVSFAHKRGLLNTSMAGAAAEGAAIDRALPIAAQDSAQATQMTLQARDAAAVRLRQLSEQGHQLTMQERDEAAQMVRQLSAQGATMTLQEKEAVAAMERLLATQQGQAALQTESLASNERQSLLAAQTSITNNQSGNQTSLTASYLQAFASLAANENLPAGTRDAYIAFFDKLVNQSRALVTSIADIPMTWGPAPAPGTAPTPAPTPAPSPAPVVPAPTPVPATPTLPPTGLPATGGAGPQPDANGLYEPMDLEYRNGRFYLPDGTEVPRAKLRIVQSGGLLGASANVSAAGNVRAA